MKNRAAEKEMNRTEKLLLLQIILEDLRGNWSNPLPRAKRALALAEELELPQFIASTKSYIGGADDYDGRWFRMSHEQGGYEGMHRLHGLYRMHVPSWEKGGKKYPYYTLLDKSEEFRKEVDDIITYPGSRFEDVDDCLWPRH